VDAQLRETFQRLMPGTPYGIDARRQLEQHLAAARGAATGLLPALQALAEARASVPGTNLESVNFKNGGTEMKLLSPDATSLDHLSQALRSNGWQADLRGGTNNAQGYEGRIELRSGGG